MLPAGATPDTAMDLDQPTTPQETNAVINVAVSTAISEPSLPSTEAPASPANPAESFKTQLNDSRRASAASGISSMTPPPSTQVPSNNAQSRQQATASQRSRSMLSPPITGIPAARLDATPSGLYNAPRPDQVVAAAPDELRAMLQACIAEQARLKTEAAHHKLQCHLLQVRADEDAQRAAVEQDMTLRQLEALRRQKTAAPRPPRKETSFVVPTVTQAMYDELRDLSVKSIKNNEQMRKAYEEACRRLKAAKKLIVRQEEDIDSLREDNEMLRNRLVDKRELWEKLASPGGIFHSPPKTTHASPAQHRQTPRQTPRMRVDRDGRQEPFAVLLQVANQENTSAPSTPPTPNRAGGRQPLKHSRGVQSLSSLPSTPNNPRARGSDLLPAADLVPHSEPPRRFPNRSSFVPGTPERLTNYARGSYTTESFARDRPAERRHSRESTISADDNQELARAALASVAQQATSFVSRGSPPPRARVPLPSHRGHHQQNNNDGEVYESQASQEASAMLRRDPRESFEVVSSHNSRDVTPTPVSAEKRLQSTLRGPIHKPGLASPAVKRKLEASDCLEEAKTSCREPTSPTKRLRLAGGLREGSSLNGLGIPD